jgi:undecaprenyl diphosphate synthase
MDLPNIQFLDQNNCMNTSVPQSKFTPKADFVTESSAMLIVPEHIAIIMDGNRRWAQTHGMPKYLGHEQGVKALEAIVEHCIRRGVKTLTVYVFSTENWKRTKQEVKYLLRLFLRFLREKRDSLLENGVRLNAIGDIARFPKKIQQVLRETSEALSQNEKLTLNIALGYGGRNEILSAIQHIIKDGVDPSTIDEQTFQKYLYTKSQKDPDLVIRTGGQRRLSNFLLWQCSYSEFYFTNVLWPDFNEGELDKALDDYSERKRNFGV